ncbi:MAG: phytanoyl-CoA dioxygenase family protein [Candidatus Parcubacteria bacterium]|nr:phytanoyl-CoA dioxygenase family protein [Burkholderiales bacterium]
MAGVDKTAYGRAGHYTVPGVFRAAEMDAAIEDVGRWGEEFLRELPAEQRRWYLDGGVKAKEVLRKLDNPHHYRESIRSLARDARLVALVEDVIGKGVSVYFSQIFFKAPEGGGPKPAHQDNYYFGPRDPQGLVTAWIAFDDATVENGCMYFGEGSQLEPLLPHAAPPGEPFNLQITAPAARMTPAPVPKGGVSFHHGGVLHQSGPNHSTRWRRACALHYVRNDNAFVNPALPYDEALYLKVTVT